MSADDARREGRGHVVRKVKTLEREVNHSLDLLREVPLDGEALEMNEEDWRQSGERQELRRLSQRLAVRAVPVTRRLSI